MRNDKPKRFCLQIQCIEMKMRKYGIKNQNRRTTTTRRMATSPTTERVKKKTFVNRTTIGIQLKGISALFVYPKFFFCHPSRNIIFVLGDAGATHYVYNLLYILDSHFH